MLILINIIYTLRWAEILTHFIPLADYVELSERNLAQKIICVNVIEKKN